MAFLNQEFKGNNSIYQWFSQKCKLEKVHLKLIRLQKLIS
jgi:hypothetical protein